MKQWRRWLWCLVMVFTLGCMVPVVPSDGPVPVMEAQAAAKPKLNKTKLSLNVGKTYTLKLKNAKKVTWKSQNKKIATVSSNGKVTAKKAGSTQVYALYKNKKYYCKVTVKKELTFEEREALARKEAQKIIEAEGMNLLTTDVEKVLAVHDYLVLNAEYDVENLEKDTLPPEAFEAYGILVKKIGVCDGYAKAFNIMMEFLGIPCERVTGNAGGVGHAWNAVTLDGERYHIDVTWDDPIPDIKGSVSYNYFLLDDATMAADHTWSFITKPCTGKKYRTYPYEAKGLKAESLEEAKEIIRKQYEAGTPEEFDIQVLAPDTVTERQILQYLSEIWIKDGQRNYSRYIPVRIGNYIYYHYFRVENANAVAA